MSAAASGERDELADSLAELFTNVSLMVRGELQGTNSQLSLLEKMNRRVAEEYNNYGDVASGLRVFVEQLNEKNQSFGEYVSQIDAIDQQVTEFEAVVSMLDKHVSLLEKKIWEKTLKKLADENVHIPTQIPAHFQFMESIVMWRQCELRIAVAKLSLSSSTG
uniref:Biogenesis of lysosome-related organelles complex 1 subunit 2 n=1 Tax=Oryza glumipatula TaxID=40148 RepID=A0A0D9YNK5_9ORYZ